MTGRSELKQRTFLAIAWTIARVGWTSLASLIVFAVLARKLDPGIFGVYTLATIMIDFIRIIATAGLTETIIREPVIDNEFADTAFWSSIIMGCLGAAAVILLAAPYAALVAQPQVVPVLYVLAIFIPVTSLGTIHLARKLREFGHKAVTMRVVCSSLLGGIVAIFCAYRGLGVWSLVVQVGASETVGVILAWQAFKWVPRLRFSHDRFYSFLSFNGHVIVSQCLWMLMTRLPEIFIGRSVGAAAVGNYRIAWRMIELLRQTINAPVGSVALVTFSHLQGDDRALQAAYKRMLGVICLLSFPLILGYGVLSHSIIYALFGNRWNAAAPIATVLSVMAIPQTINYFVGPAMLAKGASQGNSLSAFMQVFFTIALSYFAAPFGVLAVAVANVGRAFLVFPFAQFLLYRYTGINPWAVLRDVWPPLVSALVMVLALYIVMPQLQAWFIWKSVFLLLAVTFGAVVYGVALLIFGRPVLRSHLEALQMLFPR